MTDGTDPERVERVARLLREQLPGAEVTHRDPGGLGPVGFTITTGKGASILRISWERFQEDQAQTEEFVRQAAERLAPGDSLLLTADGPRAVRWLTLPGRPLPLIPPVASLSRRNGPYQSQKGATFPCSAFAAVRSQRAQ